MEKKPHTNVADFIFSMVDKKGYCLWKPAKIANELDVPVYKVQGAKKTQYFVKNYKIIDAYDTDEEEMVKVVVKKKIVKLRWRP
jgi:hypothetical protein